MRAHDAQRRRAFPAALAAAALLGGWALRAQTSADPFQFLQPVVTLSADDRRAIDAGRARVRILPAQGKEVAVVAIVSTTIDTDRLLAWVQRIEAMKKSQAIHAIQRFSDPPRLEDVSALTLSSDALHDIRDCRPADCGLKLSAAEMTSLRAAMGTGADWQARGQTAFRRLVIDRVSAYRSRGHAAIPPYEDTQPARNPADTFTALLSRSRATLDRVPGLTGALAAAPPAKSDDAFLYWSVEQFGGKPVLSVTDVRVSRPQAPDLPLAVVSGKQVFAIHYMNGSLNQTMLLRGRAGGPNYLVVLNRSEVDVIGGMFGGLARAIIERRVRNEAGEVLEALRSRMQSGPPPTR